MNGRCRALEASVTTKSSWTGQKMLAKVRLYRSAAWGEATAVLHGVQAKVTDLIFGVFSSPVNAIEHVYRPCLDC